MQTWKALAGSGKLGTAKVLEDGAVVFTRGQPARCAYVLIDGVVELYQDLDDAQLVVRWLRGPSLFGIIEACGGASLYLESVRVCGHAILHEIETERLHKLLRQNPQAALECLADAANAFCRVAETESARLASTDRLLAAALLVYGELFGVPEEGGIRIELRRSQADLANVVGVSERQVHRLLKDWEGIVDKERGRYVLRQPETLAKIAAGFEKGMVHSSMPPPGWVGDGPYR
jgi:CRP-like cAMP-binding protein